MSGGARISRHRSGAMMFKFQPGDQVRITDSYFEKWGACWKRQRLHTVARCVKGLLECSTPIDEGGIELAGGPW